jgi:gliding motility-associated-like protein
MNCPIYRLPNVFTPNGDDVHDLFLPYPFRFVDQVDFKVYSRWGNLVFETTDPDLNWDGKNLNGKELEAGTYHYTCEVFNQVNENEAQVVSILTGYIELIR